MTRFVLKLFLKILLAGIILVGLLFLLFNWPVKDKNNDMQWGISFSNIYARDIGLDWKQVYSKILEDFNPETIRIAAYWTEIEKNKGEYDFSDLDWQVKEAQKNNTNLVLVFGIKTPRWPECFIPKFYENNKKEREEALLVYEEILLNRYKTFNNIKVWQVENEPFLPFGDCPIGAVDENILDKEIEQTRRIDSSRPIMVTDSGELSLWYKAAKRGDIFGTTLYRTIHTPKIGYFTYPIGPNFFRVKAFLIKVFTEQENIIISELQAESWGPKWITDMTIEEQYHSMSPEKFDEIIEYAQKTNFSETYLWGVEWWYWLKDKKGNDEMWEKARALFNN